MKVKKLTCAHMCRSIAFVSVIAYLVHTGARSQSPVRRRSTWYEFPIPKGIRQVSIDIGLYNSIMEVAVDEFVIAIDASLREVERFKLASKCYDMRRCLLINAAVGLPISPFVTLHQSEREGGSSHITNYDSSVWPMEMRPATVPLISLKTVIDSVPQHLTISKCKTDTNGNDILVIDSAGESIRRCRTVTIEIVGPEDGTGPPDQYERAMRIMTQMGFEPADGYSSAKQLQGSYDLHFSRRNHAKDHAKAHTLY